MRRETTREVDSGLLTPYEATLARLLGVALDRRDEQQGLAHILGVHVRRLERELLELRVRFLDDVDERRDAAAELRRLDREAGA